MYNTSASELELVASDLRQIARTYTNAAQQLDQQVVTLDGAVAHVLSDGVMPWKGLSSDAFVSAWLERQVRLKQASTLMSQSAGYMTSMAQTIESNVPMIRAGQSIQLQPVFASMASNAQQAVLDEVSQAQNAIFMALAVLNSQLEAMAAEVSNCPQVDKEAGSPGLYDNISRSDAGAGAAEQTPEQRIKNEVGDAAIAEALIEQANQNGANLEDVATLLERNVSPDLISKWLGKGGDLSDLKLLLDNGASGEQIVTWLVNGDVGVGNNITPFDQAIRKALKSRNPGDQLEGTVARIAKMAGYDITAFQTDINGPTGTVTDLDVRVPGVIVEVKSGATWDLKATEKLQIKLGQGSNGILANPGKEPVIVYAPSMPPKIVAWIEKTGAHVAQNVGDLIRLLRALHP